VSCVCGNWFIFFVIRIIMYLAVGTKKHRISLSSEKKYLPEQISAMGVGYLYDYSNNLYFEYDCCRYVLIQNVQELSIVSRVIAEHHNELCNHLDDDEAWYEETAKIWEEAVLCDLGCGVDMCVCGQEFCDCNMGDCGVSYGQQNETNFDSNYTQTPQNTKKIFSTQRNNNFTISSKKTRECRSNKRNELLRDSMDD
jgi:hypothetical protein